MNVILVTDIFGHTLHVDTWVKRFGTLGVACQVISPYDCTAPNFEHDEMAYAYFKMHGGHDAYQQRLSKHAQLLACADLIIAFSAGASAVWHFSSQALANFAPKVVLFYPSHIRNQLTLRPNLPTEIIFANREPHFSVDDVMTALNTQQLEQLVLTKSQYLHGFINPESVNYNQQGALESMNVIVQQYFSLDKNFI